jgi:two-component system nitrate/nitrite response regulator NarL
MPNIVLELRDKLIKDCLSSVLANAGFLVVPKSDEPCGNIIVIGGFDDYRELPALGAQDGAKIVILASELEHLAMTPEQIGALSGILTDGLSVEDFVRSLRLICSGERVLPRSRTLGSSMSATDIRVRPDHSVRISPRERETLLDLADGHSTEMIARRLSMTEATVKVHLNSLLRKINVDNRTQAVIWALANLPGFGDRNVALSSTTEMQSVS